MATTRSDPFTWFEIPRFENTALDALFYDVNRMVTDLFLHGSIIVKGTAVPLSPRFSETTKDFGQLDLSASSNPAGSILVVDAGRPPRIIQFEDVPNFTRWVDAHGRTLRAASVTGVGSSALGSAAFAWNVSTALEEPVAAIVPGYGVADAIQQGFDGMLGVYNLWIKQLSQNVLAQSTSPAARSDRHLAVTAQGDAEVTTGASSFGRRSGSSVPTSSAQSSNVLHAILNEVPNINRVFGHSKGGVAIKNAIQSLPREMTQRLHVVTFGWSMPEDIPTAGYSQFLGRIDQLGLTHSWPSHTLIPAHHSTNTSIPLSMPVSVLTRLAMIEGGVAATRDQVRLIEGVGATTTSQHSRVARQWNDEDIHANAAD